MNDKNLKPITSKKVARELGRKGGLKKAENERKKKTMKEMLDYLLTKEITDSKGNKKETLEAICIAQIGQALKGNVKAFESIRDTIGQKPTEKKEITGSNGEPLAIKKVFVTPEEVAEAKKHIKDIIEDK